MWIDYKKWSEATRKYLFYLPFLDQILERVVGHPYYYFLYGYLDYYQISVALEDQENTTVIRPFITFTI